MGLGLAGVDVERVVDGDARGLGEVAARSLAADLHHRLHREERVSNSGRTKVKARNNGCFVDKARRHQEI